MRHALTALLVALVASSPAAAADKVWRNTTGNYIWNTTSENWAVAGLPATFSTSPPDTALFDGSEAAFGSPITVDGNLAVFGLNFTGGNYSITDGTLTLTSGGSSLSGILAGEVRVASGLTQTISSILAGSVGLTKTGTGTLTLSGTNTYSGGTTVTGGGVLAVAADSNLGAAAGPVTLSTSGTLRATATFSSARGFSLGSGGGRVDVVDGHTLTLSGNLTGAGGGLNKIGAGTLALTGSNTLSNGTVFSAGSLQVGSSGALGTTGTLFFSGGTLQYSSVNATDYSGRFAAGGSQAFSVDTNGQNVTFASALVGSGSSLTKLGAGVLTLTGNNTFTGGTTVSGGVLRIGSGTVGSLDGDVLNNSQIDFLRTDDHAFDGSISGNGLVVKSGAGTLILTGTNTFTGGTTISSGTLQVGNGGTSGSLAGDVANSSALRFNRSDDSTFDGVIFGTGSVTQRGAGTLTLTGTNTYIGGTTVVGGGVLAVAADSNLGASTGPVSLGGLVNSAPTSGTLRATATFSSARGVSLGSGGGRVDVDDGRTLTVSGNLANAGGGLTKQGPGTLVLTGSNNLSGGTVFGAGTLQVGSSGALGTTGTLFFSGGTLQYSPANATDYSGRFATGSGQLYRVDTNGQNVTFASALVGTGNSVTKLGAGILTLTGTNTYTGGTTIAGGTLSINAEARLGGAGGGLALDGGTLRFTGTGTVTSIGGSRSTVLGTAGGTCDTAGLGAGTGNVVTIASPISGSGPLTLNAHGDLSDGGGGSNSRLLLTGANTFTGGVTIGSGLVDTQSHFGNAANTLTITGGGLLGTAASSSVGRAITLGGSGERIARVFGGNVLTLSGPIDGPGGLRKTDTGTLVLTGTNTYAGGTTIAAGTLQVANGGTTGSLIGDVVNNAALIFNRSDDLTYGGGVSGSGSLTKNGAGTLTLTGANTYTGNTIISNGTLAFDRSDDWTYEGVISGSGSLTKLGGGTLTLTGANTYTGNTTISDGTLQIDNGGTSGSLLGNVFNNAAIRFNRSNDLTYAGELSGTGSLTKLGAGILTLTGTNTYTGGTTITAGTLSINSDDRLGATSGGLTLNGGTLRFTGTGSVAAVAATRSTVLGMAGGTFNTSGLGASTGNVVTIASPISGSGPLTLNAHGDLSNGGGSGDSRLILTGANTFTGGVNIGSGLVDTQSHFGDAANALTITGGGLVGTATSSSVNRAITLGGHGDRIVRVVEGSTLTLSGPINGPGAVRMTDTGTLVLTGTNTHTGGTKVVGGGVLEVSADSNLGYIGGGFLGDITIENSTLRATGSFGTARNLNVGTSARVDVVDGHTLTLAGYISANISLAKVGPGTLVLSGSHNFYNVTFGGGTLSVGGLLGPQAMLHFSGGTLQYRGVPTDYSRQFSSNNNLPYSVDTNGTAVTFASPLVGNGSTLTKLGGGTLTLTGTNTYTGGTTVSGGTLQIGDGGTLGSVIGNVVNNAALIFNLSDALTFSGVISGSGSLTKLGADILTLTGNSTFTGGTTVSGGTLQIGNGGTIGSMVGEVSLAFATVLAFNRFDTQQYYGPISGSGNLLKQGPNVLSLLGDNTYTGTTTVSSGTLLVQADQSSATGHTTVHSGGTLGGTGVVGGSVSIQSGGTLAPGASPGILTVKGPLDFDAGAIFSVDLFGTNPGSEYDRLIVDGPVNLGNASLQVQLGFTPVASDLFFILDNRGLSPIANSFDGIPQGGTVTSIDGAYFAQVSYFGDSETLSIAGGNDVVLHNFAPVPEPLTTLALGAAGVGLAAALRRRAGRTGESLRLQRT